MLEGDVQGFCPHTTFVRYIAGEYALPTTRQEPFCNLLVAKLEAVLRLCPYF